MKDCGAPWFDLIAQDKPSWRRYEDYRKQFTKDMVKGTQSQEEKRKRIKEMQDDALTSRMFDPVSHTRQETSTFN